MEWLSQALGETPARIVIWVAIILIALIAVLLVIRLLRGLMPGVFVAGGPGRRARLAVVDAAAVDSRRRLVLVRRDSTEHLLLVGGPTDIVVERHVTPVSQEDQAPGERTAAPVPEVRDSAPARVPAPRPSSDVKRSPGSDARSAPLVAPDANIAPAPKPMAERVTAAPLANSPKPEPSAPVRHQLPSPPEEQVSTAPMRAPRTPPSASATAGPTVAPVSPTDENENLEAELRKQLDEVLKPAEPKEKAGMPTTPDPNRQSLENEMSRLLKDLTDENKS